MKLLTMGGRLKEAASDLRANGKSIFAA